MLKCLLVGLDGSPTAEAVLPYVERIAKATGATVILVRAVALEDVNEPLRDDNVNLVPITVVMPSERPHAADEKARNEYYEAENYLDSVVKRLGADGIIGDSVVAPGDPASVVLGEAEARHVDLIMLATHGRSGLGRLLYGSVADKVLAHSTVPVFLARAATHGQTSHFGEATAPILLALDGTPESERALSLAQELARAFSAGLALVEVVPVVAPVMTPDSGWMTDIPLDVQAREEETASNYLNDLSRRIRVSGLPVSAAMRRDAVGVGIVTTAVETGAALIVMATHGSTGLVRALVGSVTLDVLHRASLPLLLIGPHVVMPVQAVPVQLAAAALDRSLANVS